MPFWMRVVRRVVTEQLDLQEHNEYLTRTNGDLTEENGRLARENETLRWRVGDAKQAPLELGAED